MTAAATGNDEHAPLISHRLLTRLTIGVAVLAGLTVAISVAGRVLGERIALAGHTENAEPVDVVIGQDQIRLPANTIRFEEQRQTGRTERVDLYLTWPEMRGYSNADRGRFNDANRPEGLVFLNLSQSTMSKDMSGRMGPIYSHLFGDTFEPGPAGLVLRRLKENSGYGDEVFFTGRLPDGSDYAVRCMMPADEAQSTSADCQRDIHIGQDLSVLYRFSSRLLPQWQAMEVRIRDYLGRSLIRNGRPSPSTGLGR
ncbi:hypothetical protein [Shinella sp. JR1-6]|uniref:hypothetical protein n=1 Tax=Shinella sp. JR1-6 TaxID=2527671 RepID=UPI00102D6204|nr:hypothetical protein [Shinella sp. JR1-6]TAA61677.1 hypothetical protein EXZ48_11065 [Shinella sp. JR1-6]